MKREISANELHILLEAITSSEVVESRVHLITELGDLDVTEGSRLATLLQSLTIFWEDFTCLDVSQCMLNKAILHVASKYVDSDLSQCLSHFLVLGTKASIWCQKHLKMTLMSTEDSQEEEHSSIFFQLLLDFLRFSASGFSILARYPVSSSKELMVITEKFVLELLNLTKDSISEIKRINSCGSELLKLAQSVLDASIQLCKVYCSGIKWDLFDSNTPNGEEAKVGNHAVNITKCTIEKLSELGVFAANDGGSLVSVLNLSWKGVVTLLQLGEGTLGVKMNALDVILTLISLANKSLKCVAETWSSSPKEKVSVAESKRIFLPVKFYLINAVRIISQYPSQAFLRYKDITICTLMISSFRMSLSREGKLLSASEALTELLEPTSFHLLNSLLNSAQVKPDQKFEILNWLFSDINYDFAPGSDSMGEIFSVKCDSMHGARILLLGRLALFLNLLKSATDLEEELRVGIATKLKWVLEIIVEEDVYSSVLDLEVPILYNSGQSKSKTQELSYQPMFAPILTALKTFMIVVSSSTQAWEETFTFLLENFLHPHFLCQEIVMELLSFMVRYGDTELVNEIIDKLCLLLRFVGSTESVFNGSVLQKIARSICVLLTYGSQSLVDRVYDSLIVSTRSNKSSSSVHIALLMEEFPLHLLSDKVKTTATQRIVAEYFGFLEEFDDVSLKVSGSSVYGSPLFALSAALHSLQVNVSDTDMKTLKLLVSMIRKYKKSTENSAKDHYRKLISETLGIISNMKHLYASDEMETVLLELKNLFISGPTVPDTQLFQCKPNLALFMAGLGHIELTESDNSAKSSAIWELYHMLLKERHWALVHLALSAFGYFAARTSCNQLWRFVPEDAALSFDLESGSEANEERFMNELKGFLEKEIGRIIMPESCWLLKEGLKLKEKVKKIASFEQDFVVCEKMEVDNEKEKQGNKRRKLPDGISKGVELLQSGMKVIGYGISVLEQNQMECVELHDSFLTQFSRLEDVISHLANLAGSGKV